jgi:type II secretory pathway component PulJ
MSKSDQRAQRARERIAEIRRLILAMEEICSGTLTRRMTTCGNPNCRCARGERHGPYVRWGHMVKGRLVQRWLSPEEALRFTVANRSYRELKRLLRVWERESITLLEDPDRSKS